MIIKENSRVISDNYIKLINLSSGAPVYVTLLKNVIFCNIYNLTRTVSIKYAITVNEPKII